MEPRAAECNEIFEIFTKLLNVILWYDAKGSEMPNLRRVVHAKLR